MVDTISELPQAVQDFKVTAAPVSSDKYKDLLKEREKFEKRKWISGEEISEIIIDLRESPLLDATYARVLDRMKKETSFLKPYEDKEVDYEVKVARPVDDFQGTKIDWNADEILGDSATGAYDVLQDRMLFSGTPAQKDEVLLQLATEGEFPSNTLKIVHEATHKYHARKGSMARALEHVWYLGKTPIYHQELKEIHAFRSGELPIHKVTQKELVEYLMKNRPGSNSERLEYSVKAIDTMHALKYPDEEIEEYVMNPGSWDPKRKVYTRLQKSLEYVAEKKGLTQDDIQEAFDLYALSLEVENYKVQAIAQDELIKYKEAA